MSFLIKYPITARYLPKPSKRRSGLAMSPGVRFIVAHDTGNPNSSAAANVKYYENSAQKESASAHLFVDDHEILECIPAVLGAPEKAWHVLYNTPTDNQLFGFNANDAAIGVEYCYGDKINADEAYRRYVWLIAYLCHTYKLDPAKSIVGHFFLDPQRKSDPVTGLAHSRRSYEQLLRDVVTEYNVCLGKEPPPAPAIEEVTGMAVSTARLNLRKGKASTSAPIARTLTVGTEISYTGLIRKGEAINGNTVWYRTADNEWFWSGGVFASSH
ncbi:MAG: peptidoglycan recognition family protein [Gallionella sp.]